MDQELIKHNKKQLRIEIEGQFLNYPSKELLRKSEIISKKVEYYASNSEISTILCYYPILHEVDIIRNVKFFLKIGKEVLLPKMIGNKMYAVIINSIDDLEVGRFGINEPKSSKPYKGKIDLVIVPGLIFSREGVRIGRGHGYYDKFLSESIVTRKIGVCFDFQLKENLEKEDFDVNMDDIVYA